MIGRTTFAFGVLAVMAVVCSGCTATASDGVALTIGTDDGPGVPAADQISAFESELEAGAGDVELEPVWHAAGDASDWDQAVADLVIDGELDLAVIPSRAWASFGVTTLDPLTTPFLIQSDEALAEVLGNDQLMEQMFAGLPEAGVVGIAAFPEGLRRPFGYHGALLTPSDYAGGVVRTATAEVNRSLYTALGATVTDDEPDFELHLGTDSSYLLEPYGTATGNVAFYPKVNVLVANADLWASLDQGDRDGILAAAMATQEHVRETQSKDAAAARAWCAGGGTIVAASPEQIQAFEEAAQPVIDRIAATGENRGIIASIEAIVDGVDSPEPTSSCDVAPPAPDSPSLIAGTYRWEVTEESIAAAGIATEQCHEVCGIYTWTLAPDGTWRFRWEAPGGGGEVSSAHGTWEFDGTRLTFLDPAYHPMVMTVAIGPSGELTMTPYEGLEEVDRAALTTTPWMKVE